MLIIRVYINLDEIDLLCIQNTGREEGGLSEYRIIKPAGVKEKIMHRREDGYRPLLKKVLETLERRGIIQICETLKTI